MSPSISPAEQGDMIKIKGPLPIRLKKKRTDRKGRRLWIIASVENNNNNDVSDRPHPPNLKPCHSPTDRGGNGAKIGWRRSGEGQRIPVSEEAQSFNYWLVFWMNEGAGSLFVVTTVLPTGK